MTSDPLQTLSPTHAFGPAVHSAATHHHSIPFGHQPGAQPGQLSHGFGLSAASNLNTAPSDFGDGPGPGWGTLPSWAQARSGAAGFGSPGPTAITTGAVFGVAGPSQPLSSPTAGAGFITNNRRKRRGSSPDSDDSLAVRDSISTNSSPIRLTHNHKKLRPVAAPQIQQSIASPDSLGLNGLSVAGRDEQDVGKALASLSREQLLGILSALVQTQPALRPTIAALLPAPTLDSTLSALAQLERAITSAIPAGAGARPEYVWGRVRGPVEEYVAEARSYLGSFTAAINSSSATPVGEDDLSHPSTTFAFLYALTSSLRRLEVALPPAPSSPLAPGGATATALSGHLLPLSINAWHVFLTRLSAAVNVEGRIMSAATVAGWFQRLEEVSVASPAVAGRGEGPARKAVEGVRDRLKKEVGWMVGLREVGGMEGEEEL